MPTPDKNSDSASKTGKKDAPVVSSDVSRIEDDLRNELEQDNRLQSGVPPERRRSDLDFIKMTGLTRPNDETPVEESSGPVDRPLSFYEEGVADVDAALASLSGDTIESHDDVITPVPDRAAEPVPERDAAADDVQPAPETEEEGAHGVPDTSWLEDASQDDALDGAESTPPPKRHVDLSEAEQLMRELHDPVSAATEPRETSPRPADSEVAAVTAPPMDEASTGSVETEGEMSIYDRQSPFRGRRRGSFHKRRKVRWGQWLLLFLLVLTALAGAYAGFNWYLNNMTDPQRLYRSGQQMMAREDYAGAASRFSSFAERNPNAPDRGTAIFLAALATQMTPADTPKERESLDKAALTLFQQFIAEFETHPKVDRARTMTGLLYYDLGLYTESIDQLRDPELRLRDPIGALPALRTLARAYAKLGDYKAAESAYLQAASLSGNYSPDVDYNELGHMFRTLAERADDSEARDRYMRRAIEQWQYAVQNSAIDPTSKRQIRRNMDVLEEKLRGGLPPAPEEPAADVDESGPAAGTGADDADEELPGQAVSPENTADPSLITDDVKILEPEIWAEEAQGAMETAPAETSVKDEQTE